MFTLKHGLCFTTKFNGKHFLKTTNSALKILWSLNGVSLKLYCFNHNCYIPCFKIIINFRCFCFIYNIKFFIVDILWKYPMYFENSDSWRKTQRIIKGKHDNLIVLLLVLLYTHISTTFTVLISNFYYPFHFYFILFYYHYNISDILHTFRGNKRKRCCYIHRHLTIVLINVYWSIKIKKKYNMAISNNIKTIRWPLSQRNCFFCMCVGLGQIIYCKII